VATRKIVRRITENRSRIKIIVIGWNVSFATLNQMNEKDQKIIDNTTAPYVFTFLFNLSYLISPYFSGAANLYFKLLLLDINLTFFGSHL